MAACFYESMQTVNDGARVRIEFDGFEKCPGLRRDLLAFIDVFCADMTLAQAREWFDDAFTGGRSVPS